MHSRALVSLLLLVSALAVSLLAPGCAAPVSDSETASEPPAAVAPQSAPTVDRAQTDEPESAPGSEPSREPGREAEASSSDPDLDPKPDPDAPSSKRPDLAPLSDREVEFGANFQPLADEFGLTRYARARRTPTGNGLVFDYLPEGETLADWRYRGTLRVIRVADTWVDGVELLPRYIAVFQEGIGENLRDLQTWDFPEGAVSFFDYDIHNEGITHHNLAAVWQVLPGHFAIFEVHRFGARFEPWQIERFREVAQRLGRADRPATP